MFQRLSPTQIVAACFRSYWMAGMLFFACLGALTLTGAGPLMAQMPDVGEPDAKKLQNRNVTLAGVLVENSWDLVGLFHRPYDALDRPFSNGIRLGQMQGPNGASAFDAVRGAGARRAWPIEILAARCEVPADYWISSEYHEEKDRRYRLPYAGSGSKFLDDAVYLAVLSKKRFMPTYPDIPLFPPGTESTPVGVALERFLEAHRGVEKIEEFAATFGLSEVLSPGNWFYLMDGLACFATLVERPNLELLGDPLNVSRYPAMRERSWKTFHVGAPHLKPEFFHDLKVLLKEIDSLAPPKQALEATPEVVARLTQISDRVSSPDAKAVVAEMIRQLEAKQRGEDPYAPHLERPPTRLRYKKLSNSSIP